MYKNPHTADRKMWISGKILKKEEIDKELEKGYSEVIDGKAVSAKDAFNDMNKK